MNEEIVLVYIFSSVLYIDNSKIKSVGTNQLMMWDYIINNHMIFLPEVIIK